jgi:hypothetical protein
MDEFWMNYLQYFLGLAAPVVAAATFRLLWALGSKAWAEFKEAQPSIAWNLETAASFAVKAAEQAKASDYIQDKKTYALDIAEKWLAARGFPVDLDLLDAAIEAAVYDEFNRSKESPKPTVFGS